MTLILCCECGVELTKEEIAGHINPVDEYAMLCNRCMKND